MASSNVDVSLGTAKGLERQLTVKVPNADIEREISARLAKVGKTARIKGFRPGKVPAKVVRQRFGGQVRQEVLADVVRSSFSRAVTQAQLNPAGGPAIEPLAGADGEHFVYRATFEVYPEIELKALEKLSVDKPVVDITDGDVTSMIEKLRVQRAGWRPVERRAGAGDRVVVDFAATIDGAPFAGGEGKGVNVVVGGGQVLADFDAALVGIAAGETKSAQVAFPANYGAVELAGRQATFEIVAHAVEERALPELDAEFFGAFGVTEGGVDALRVEVRKNMQRELDERVRAETRSHALTALLAANKVDAPNALVQQETESLRAEAMRRMGVTDPKQGPSAVNLREPATRRVKLALLVREIIARHKIELDRGRVDRRVEELASPYENPGEASRLYRGSRELMAQIESQVLEEQVVDFLVERGKPKERKVGFEEFMGMGVAK